MLKGDHMKLALLGGTGALGRGLALRLAIANYSVQIGSRSKEKAERTCSELSEQLRTVGRESTHLTGHKNSDAAEAAELAILTVPPRTDAAFVQRLKRALAQKIVVDCTVNLDPTDVTRIAPGHAGNALELQKLLGDQVTVVAGFHTLAAAKLSDLSKALTGDTFLAADSTEAKDKVTKIAQAIGLRCFDTGPLETGLTLERLTAMLIYMNKRYRKRALGLKLDGM